MALDPLVDTEHRCTRRPNPIKSPACVPRDYLCPILSSHAPLVAFGPFFRWNTPHHRPPSESVTSTSLWMRLSVPCTLISMVFSDDLNHPVIVRKGQTVTFVASIRTSLESKAFAWVGHSR